MLGLIDPTAALAHLRAADPVMAQVIDRVGPFELRDDTTQDPFHALSRSIVFQQLSGKAAGTIFSRFVAIALGGDPVAVRNRTSPEWAPGEFPSPAQVLALPEESLRAAGLSRQKAASVRSLAEHFVSGALDARALHALPDEEVIARLTQVRGIGRWTAEMFLLFHLRRADVLPVNDVGINRAILRQYGVAALPKPAEVLAIGEPWRPHASVACWYLWRSEDTATIGD
ncbi:MAG: DNA-3-methyladenine glycosylase family protein [Dehalococcoidia bacterium]